ncbi:MAG: divalent-cation tolerance protein CutA [Candidatus Rokubacteria bacterium]|nr:divalent-cation tolerance protein CutA [Candidatus Rokubacteria bacterium]
MTDVCVVLSTAPSAEEGIGIGRRLVEEQLAACVNVVPGARSLYIWDGALQETDEALLVIKTRRDQYPALARRIQELHSYSVPEILAVPVESGSPAYVDWVRATTGPGGGEASP